MASRALVILIMIPRLSSATTIRELKKNKVYYSSVMEGTQHTQGHTGWLWVERDGVSSDLGFCFYWGGRWGASDFTDSLFIGECNPQEQVLKPGKGKRKQSAI